MFLFVPDLYEMYFSPGMHPEYELTYRTYLFTIYEINRYEIYTCNGKICDIEA